MDVLRKMQLGISMIDRRRSAMNRTYVSISSIQTLVALLAILALLTSLTSSASDNTVVNPTTNVPLSSSKGATKVSDERLAKKITYFSGYVRLSDAVSRISRLCGISIATGRNQGDWQVRDMPVIICANDIQLGRLLQFMADAYSLTLSRSEVKGVYSYRLFRPDAYQAIIDGYVNNESEYPLRHAQFEWQTLSYVGSLKPNEADDLYQKLINKNHDFGILYGDPRLVFDEVVMCGKLINSIDQSLYPNLLAGEEIVLSARQGGRIGQLVQDFVRLKQRIVRAMRSRANTDTGDLLGESQIAAAQIRFSLDRNRGFALDGAVFAGTERFGFGPGDLLSFGLSARNSGIEPLTQRLPTSPLTPSLKEMRYFRPIPKDGDAEANRKYKFEWPSKERICLADILTVLSKTVGCSIVADDYSDHKDDTGISAKSLVSGQKSLSDVRNYLGSQYVWYTCPGANTLAVKSKDWFNRYANLISKDLFCGWLYNLQDDGLELTDYLTARNLSPGQKADWIAEISTLSPLMALDSNRATASLVGVLSSMNQDDLSSAMSSGVPVTSLDVNQWTLFANSLSDDSKPREDAADLWLRVIKAPRQGKRNTYTYSVEIIGNKTSLRFPIWQNSSN